MSYKILSENDRVLHLQQKLLEEVQELCESNTKHEAIAEIADVYDILSALSKTYNQHKTQLNDHRDIDSLRKNLMFYAEEIARKYSYCDEKILHIYVLLNSLANHFNININEISEVREQKNKKRGGFELGIYVNYIEISEDSEAIQYFVNQPKKYPVIL